MVVAGVVQLAGGDEMIVDQDSPVRIPDLLKAHLLEFVFDKGNKNIVDHHAVDVHGDDVAGFDRVGADIVCEYFFNKGGSHTVFLLNDPVD